MAAFEDFLVSPSRTVIDLDTGIARRLKNEVDGVDLGDIDLDTLPNDVALGAATAGVGAICARGGVPVLLGGDAGIAECLLLGACRSSRPVGAIVLSPSLVLPATVDAKGRAIGELIATAGRGSVYGLLCIGTIGLQPKSAWDRLCEVGGHVLAAELVHTVGIAAAAAQVRDFVAQYERIICVIDLEVIDAGHAAGTPGITVGGLTPEQLIDLVKEARFGTKLAGIAVTNVAPDLDRRGHTEQVAALALHAALGEFLEEEFRP
jgi:agmatinase